MSRIAFTQIPKNDEGELFLKLAKKYLNKEDFTLVKRGQKIDKKKYNWREFPYGYPNYACTHMRIYINPKNNTS